jgi:hypothetical protein
MTTSEREAAEGLYSALRLMPCLCRRMSDPWPFRSQVVVDGKHVDPPPEICSKCRAMAAWDAVKA